MTTVSCGWITHTQAAYYDYVIWLAERNMIDAMRRHDKIYFVVFEEEQDAVAFKLRFGL